MKYLKLFTLSSLALCAFPLMAQEETEVVVVEDSVALTPQQEYFQNKYYGQNRDYVKFTSDQKKFNDWSIAVYAGLPIVQGADLNTAVSDHGMEWGGYDLQAVLTKQITHAFGLGLQFNYGKTKQMAFHGKDEYKGHTDYWMWSLQGDLNFSNLFRRVDNKSRYAWALHGYGGIGTLQYDAYINKNGGADVQTAKMGGFGSVYINGGGGLRYKVSQRLDIEAKAMYYFTGDEEFDGSTNGFDNGAKFQDGTPIGPVANFEEGKDDGLFTFSIGALLKLGKHHEHLSWADPLADIYPGPSPEELQAMLVVCAQGDHDDDGVCDDWDRELNTPLGARVDGAGRALDTDLDGVIDLYDKCVTLPGPADNDGCPLHQDAEAAINLAISNLEFSLDSDVISPSYYPLLDKAAEYLKYYKDDVYNVVGHTDTRASEAYNMNLSRRRAQAVKDYLVQKHGVPSEQLNVVAMGEKDLRFPQCKPATKCPEWMNHANRRVVFVKQ
ncbi:OmpA family protein [Ornithobacterium rhinotracheale]|uniref:OmpA family protein n=1 Tax=Ornithobacterium rhinotracheale TaxID=28251 RepID=UPI00129C936D|nr:OmpA family protein [Ornithobacterium rhinotracheale]MRI62427.1 OmpA family protein [Ornithobacterium rhinotracheale]